MKTFLLLLALSEGLGCWGLGLLRAGEGWRRESLRGWKEVVLG